ncbi:MAG: multiprotein-bridging factor 1 family protein [Actinomycetes bacterium]
MSQRELAERSGLKQPLIAAIEAGRRRPSDAARTALDRALAVRPSVALALAERTYGLRSPGRDYRSRKCSARWHEVLTGSRPT